MTISKVTPEHVRVILGDKVKHLSNGEIKHIASYFDSIEGRSSEFNQFKFIGWKKCYDAKAVLKHYLPKSEFDEIVKEYEAQKEPYMDVDCEHYENLFYKEKLSYYCETISYICDSTLYRWYKK